MKAKDLRGACTVTAHLALLSKSVDLEVGTSHLASLLSSFVFLTHNFVWDAEQSGDLPAVKRESSEAGKANALGVPQTQVFDLYQQKRHQIVEMLRKQDSASHSMGTGLGGPYQKRLNDVMEAVTRVTRSRAGASGGPATSRRGCGRTSTRRRTRARSAASWSTPSRRSTKTSSPTRRTRRRRWSRSTASGSRGRRRRPPIRSR